LISLSLQPLLDAGERDGPLNEGVVVLEVTRRELDKHLTAARNEKIVSKPGAHVSIKLER
tara:strand:+ start:267 stop:446 length:180 start_codon:yes stop_codon:yes gene_type:complete